MFGLDSNVELEKKREKRTNNGDRSEMLKTTSLFLSILRFVIIVTAVRFVEPREKCVNVRSRNVKFIKIRFNKSSRLERFYRLPNKRANYVVWDSKQVLKTCKTNVVINVHVFKTCIFFVTSCFACWLTLFGGRVLISTFESGFFFFHKNILIPSSFCF